MMKSWADHCSSDEEDSVHDSELLQEEEDAMLAEQTANKLDLQEEPVVPDEVVSQGEGEHQQDNQPRPITDYDFPMNPPFTAFIGNLSYNIKEVPQLIEAVSDLAKDRLGQNINVIGGRIAYHRTGEPGKHRGFGYVEVETLDELKTLMKLNDGQSMIAGRKIQLDTANNKNNNNNNYNRRGSQNTRGSFQRGSFSGPTSSNNGNHKSSNNTFGDIDGSKFRGGKHHTNNNSNRRGSQRNDNDQGTRGGSAPLPQNNDAAGPPAQRPSLKLAPRTKPVDSAVNDRLSSSSNIFGGATARDEQIWQQRRMSQQKDQEAKDGKESSEEHVTSDEKVTADEPTKENGTYSGASAPEEKGGTLGSKSSQTQDRRQNERGRAGWGRAGGRGGGRNDKGDSNRRGPRKSSLHQDKKDKQQQKQPSPDEKAGVAAAKAQAAATVPQAPPKKTEASNKFALLMDDSDSD